MMLRYLIVATLFSAASVCAAAGWPKPDTDAGTSLLRADQAFQLMPPTQNKNGVTLEWVIAPGYFLYRNRIHVERISPAGNRPVALKLPTAQAYNEAGEGIVQIYRNDLSTSVPMPVGGESRRLRVRYQGCSYSGVCYPPQTRILQLKDSQ